MVADAARFATILESLYSGIEALDTSGYQSLSSDGWTQVRGMASGAPTVHLACMVVLGGIVTDHAWGTDRQCQAMFAHRYNPDDDSLSQAQLAAAQEALCDFLRGWPGTEAGDIEAAGDPIARVISIDGSQIEPRDAQWTDCAVNFTLRLGF